MLADISLWLDDRLFWPAFLLSVGGSDTAAVAFDVDPADVEEYAEQLHHPDSWPFISLPLGGGHGLHILFRNFEDDAGWDYLLQPAGSDTVTTLAALEGCFQGPGLSWPELLVAAGQPDPARSWSERLLLLLPALGDADLPHDADEPIISAFAAVGGLSQQRYKVAHELLTASRRFWGDPTWTEYADRRVRLGRHSPRGPAAPPDRLALIAEALGSGS
ncbi:hypothetical protein Val02_49320 [Virgisporangium aliadipatigenens]|uniref:Uncharacterized protein n=1 Tax=Virgisporangium aliadipatigenens TaxID=741659 RepID=A0A8J3YMM8_9ACTN|nr:hypothetical protein [Virgisporangium aliadipatigenens]GIJ48046.1 hypothetical protein Val02_49320 [Virgisporangium aliadipatigenens]